MPWRKALLYLQDLEDEWSASGVPSPSKPTSIEEGDYEEPVKRRRKRKKAEEVDEDFVVSEDVLQAAENEEAESERLSDISESELESIKTKSTATYCQKESPTLRGFAENGFYCSIMAPVWKATEVTMEYHDLNHSYWEFPEWIPNKENWHILSAR
ncbi:Hypothetical predicted protein [Pelobates cultripes]|uniref:Uncharacterized protein n=1 Tax=Pelobates cultripes TaxID=61616 RepID=A0AAD1VSJ2_PELCU|nr:Hypothetical predicted protein [Pelobates cultripes]